MARDILSFKLRYAKSLRRMRAGDQANLKMKEMTFLARTSNHIFKGLGEFYMFSLRVLSYSPFSKRYFHYFEYLLTGLSCYLLNFLT